jgi:hypothetical protein
MNAYQAFFKKPQLRIAFIQSGFDVTLSAWKEPQQPLAGLDNTYRGFCADERG